MHQYIFRAEIPRNGPDRRKNTRLDQGQVESDQSRLPCVEIVLLIPTLNWVMVGY